jgi:uncharacterized repeat protein (TIGR01451 family)
MPQLRIAKRLALACLTIALIGLVSLLTDYSIGSRAASAGRSDAGALDATLGRGASRGKRAGGAQVLTEPTAQEQARISEAYGKLPLSFEANRGQTDPQVSFISRGSGYRLFLTSTEAVLALGKGIADAVPEPSAAALKKSDSELAAGSNAVLRMRLKGANPHAQAEGLERQAGQTNYLIGNRPEAWHTNVESYAKVRYTGVYPGIDLVYYGNQRRLEYDFIVAPGARADRIRLDFKGAQEIFIDGGGELVLRTAHGDVRQHKPLLYQEVNGRRHEVAGRYVMKGRQVGFEVGDYDRSRALVIDPVLVYSTYLGGSSNDRGFAIAVDGGGNAYVAGSTLSANFPTLSPAQGSLNGTSDAYVVKLNAAGSAIVYATYLGGSGGETAFGVAVDSSGNAYVTGSTGSSNFPTVNPAQATYRGGGDIFIAKLNAAGSALVYSTYWGGVALERGLAVAVDTAGNAYVTGPTESGNFPAVNALQAVRNGSPVFKSTNGGNNWNASGTGLNASNVRELVVNPTTPTTVYAATEIGVYKSGDSGQTWSAVNQGLPDGEVSDLVIDRLNPQTLYAATTFNGVYKTTDGGATWNKLNAPPEDFRVLAIDPINTQTLYAGGFFGNAALYKTTDGGASWNPTGANISNTTVIAIAVDPVNPANVYASSGSGLYKSQNAGGSWSRLNSPNLNSTVLDLAIDPSNSTTLYAATDLGVFKSTNGGVTWAKLNLPIASFVFSVIIDPANTSTVYVGANNPGGIQGPHVFKSTDGGNFWASIPMSFDTQAEITLAINPINTSIIYAGAYCGTEALLVKLNPSGTSVLYSTYMGGDSSDGGLGVAADAAGNAYVAGATSSSNFPTASALQGPHGAPPFDAFVAKVNPTGSAFIYSTYLGGAESETASAVAVDSSGNAYVTGNTNSTDFPTVNPLQGACNSCFLGGGSDAFVTKLSPNGSALIYSTYVGGNSDDWAHGIAVDPAGSAYITGETSSTNLLPLNAPQPFKNGATEAFAAKLNPAGSSLLYSTYLGGGGQDFGFGIGVGPDGSAYVAGHTLSNNFPVAAALQPGRAGNIDTFITRIAPSDASGAGADLSITMTDSPDPVQSGQSINYTITVINNGPSTATGVIVNTTVAATPSQGTCSGQQGIVNCNLGNLASGAQATLTATVSPSTVGPATVTNSAWVGANEADPSLVNNRATETTTIGTTISISGRITRPDGTGFGGVPVMMQANFFSANTTTDPQGNYTFDGLAPGGSFTITPSLTNFTFSPASLSFLTISQSVTGANFVGTPTSTAPVLQFSQAAYSASEGDSFLTIIVTRGGDLSVPVKVKYSTSDTTDANFRCDPTTQGQPTGVASRKCDYHITVGTLRFAAGESTRQFTLSLVNDVYVEGPETFTLTLSNPTGAALGQNSSVPVTITDDDVAGAANPIDNTSFFVRQLYVDLLSREPDPAGWNGWTTRIDQCGQPGQPPPPCDRVTVGGDGFLRSGEFFDRQFFVLRLYRTGLGRILRYDDVGDLAFVSGFLTAEQLELNKQDLVSEIMARPEFSNIYNGLNDTQFVDTLLQTAAITVAADVRQGWITALGGAKTRAQVYREISERPEVSNKYLHEAQVVSAYYGFFTRNPDGAYLNYLQRLDSGEINLADLANAFINAQEYRQRFGQ